LLDGTQVAKFNLSPVIIGSAIARMTSRGRSTVRANHMGVADLAYGISVAHADANNVVESFETRDMAADEEWERYVVHEEL